MAAAGLTAITTPAGDTNHMPTDAVSKLALASAGPGSDASPDPSSRSTYASPCVVYVYDASWPLG
jgi:hypothetical protein